MAKAIERVCPECGIKSSFRSDQRSCGCTSRKPSETSEVKGDEWTISLPKTRIHTLEELLAYCEVDPDIWLCERFQANKWEMGFKTEDGTADVIPLFQVKAFLKRRQNVAFAKTELEALRKKALEHVPKYPAPAIIKSKSGNLVEFSVADHHFGALIWSKETGGDDYDTKLAKECYEDAVIKLIARTENHNPEKVILVIGNDQQNSDNQAGTTTRGTPQTMDSRYQKVFAASRDASIWAIDALLAKFGKVDVVAVPGNHDYLATYHLADSLTSWYRNCKSVQVDNSPNPRKYYQWGTVGLMFAHGNTGRIEEYDRTFAAERPDLWSACRWREAHTGDKHHRKLIELKGATVRILPSLRPPCAWSADNHFVGAIRAAEAYVWNNTEGLVATATYSILDKHNVN